MSMNSSSFIHRKNNSGFEMLDLNETSSLGSSGKKKRKTSQESIGHTNWFKLFFTSCFSPCGSQAIDKEDLETEESYYTHSDLSKAHELVSPEDSICYRTIFKTSNPIIAWDSNYVLVTANQAAIKLLGFEILSDIKGKRFDELFVKEAVKSDRTSLEDIELITEQVDITVFKALANGTYRKFPVLLTETKRSKNNSLCDIITSVVDYSETEAYQNQLNLSVAQEVILADQLRVAQAQIKELAAEINKQRQLNEQNLIQKIPAPPAHMPNAELDECKKIIEVQKKTLANAQMDRDRYRSAFHYGPPALCLDNDNNIVEWNNAAKKLLGLKAEEMNNLVIDDLLVGTKVINSGFFNEQDQSVTWRLGGCDRGFCKGLAVRISPHQVTFYDITTQFLYKKALDAFVNYFYIEYNKNGVIMSGHNIEKILGYSDNELVNTKTFDLIHEDDLDRLASRQQGEEQGALKPEKVRYMHKDGHYVSLEFVGWSSGDSLHCVAREI